MAWHCFLSLLGFTTTGTSCTKSAMACSCSHVHVQLMLLHTHLRVHASQKLLPCVNIPEMQRE